MHRILLGLDVVSPNFASVYKAYLASRSDMSLIKFKSMCSY
jgi:hypothetical protein